MKSRHFRLQRDALSCNAMTISDHAAPFDVMHSASSVSPFRNLGRMCACPPGHVVSDVTSTTMFKRLSQFFWSRQLFCLWLSTSNMSLLAGLSMPSWMLVQHLHSFCRLSGRSAGLPLKPVRFLLECTSGGNHKTAFLQERFPCAAPNR